MQAEVERHIHQLLTHSCQMADHFIAGWIQLLVCLQPGSTDSAKGANIALKLVNAAAWCLARLLGIVLLISASTVS